MTEFERFQGYPVSRANSLAKRKVKNGRLKAAYQNNVAGDGSDKDKALQGKVARLDKQDVAADVALAELQGVEIVQSSTSVAYLIDEGNANGELVSMQRKRVNRKEQLEETISVNRDDLIPSLQDDLGNASVEDAGILQDEIDRLQKSIDNAEQSLGELNFIEIRLK